MIFKKFYPTEYFNSTYSIDFKITPWLNMMHLLINVQQH